MPHSRPSRRRVRHKASDEIAASPGRNSQGGFDPVTSAGVLIRSPRRLRLFGGFGGPLAGGCALLASLALTAVGCTSVTGGDATVNASDAPGLPHLDFGVVVPPVASSSARESERQAF